MKPPQLPRRVHVHAAVRLRTSVRRETLPPENLLKDTDGVLVASPPLEGAGRSNTQPISDLSGAVANCVCFLLTRASLDDVIAFEGSRS